MPKINIKASLVTVVLISCLIHAGCSKTSPMPDAATPAPALKDVGEPLSESEATGFAKKLAAAFEVQDTDAVEKIIRLDSFAERVVSDLKLSEKERNSFMKSVNEALRKGTLTQDMVETVENGGSYDFLRIHTVNGRPRPLFRLLGVDGGLNYHEFILVRNKDGQIEVEDIYIYATGSPVSQNMRQALIPALADHNFMKAMDPKELSTLETMLTIGKSIRNGEFQVAADAYHTLPKEKQELKAVMIVYMGAVARLGEESDAEYLATMEKFRQLYPKDPALDLMSIDYYYLKGQISEAIKAIQRLDKAVGGDPYLDMFRGSMLMQTKHYDEARLAIEKAIKEEPDMENAYWSRVTLALEEKNHDDTLKWLKAILKTFHGELADLNEIPEYAEFVKSPQYVEFQKWSAERNKNPE